MRRTLRSRASCDLLESRRLLSTYVINGSSGADSWTISADAGQITVNGTRCAEPSVLIAPI